MSGDQLKQDGILLPHTGLHTSGGACFSGDIEALQPGCGLEADLYDGKSSGFQVHGRHRRSVDLLVHFANVQVFIPAKTSIELEGRLACPDQKSPSKSLRSSVMEDIMKDFEGRVILVTGGASGLGAKIVELLAARGARVAIADYDIAAARMLAEEIDGAKAYQVDVTKSSDIDDVVASIVADFGRLDGAVNNAGIGGKLGSLHECSDENWAAVLSVNLNGVFYSARAEIRHFLTVGGGVIVNTASMAGLLAERGLPAYVSSKHGVIGLTKSIALDYGSAGIRCNAICPTFFETPMTGPMFADPGFQQMLKIRHPLGRAVTVNEVAESVVFLLSDQSSGMTGVSFQVDAGASVS
ncbi:SDR family oxidoreductase [Rhizobium sp. FY34]|uniref:SDR family NAD(P)-dependent oxidoreductase n=1 Tax=Rhizobium sp. FY34 TaxID=2562309 RepID=UPI0010C13DFD|nr:SDR family oxidoreductase [Rhizobium sp. FY34]